jgi:hypothetical protein
MGRPAACNCHCGGSASSGSASGSGSGGASSGGGSGSGSGSGSGVWKTCIPCSNFIPLAFNIAWPYTGTGSAVKPCCGNYDGVGSIRVEFAQSIVVPNQYAECSWLSPATLSRANKPAFDPWECLATLNHLADLRIRVPINILDQPVGDITAEVNINYAEQLTGYRCQYGKITGLGQQVIGTYPFNCVSNFSLPLVGSAWGPSGFVSPCASESVPMTVDVTPA